MRAHALRRQLVGRDDRRHLRRHVSRPHRHAVADELHGVGRGHATEDRVRVPAAVAKLLGGIRPPLTRSVLKAFLGPTTFTTRPDVVAFVRDTVQAVDVASCSLGGQERGAGAARSARAAGAGEDARARGRGLPRMRRSRWPRRPRWPRPFPDAAFAVLDGVAHLAGLENPPLVNKLIEEFVFRG